MRLCLFLAALIAVVVITECKHTFIGTNVDKELVLHRNYKYTPDKYDKRIELVSFHLPEEFAGRTIQGVLAYDNTNSGAKALMHRSGGIGFDFMALRFVSEINSSLDYDVYIYA